MFLDKAWDISWNWNAMTEDRVYKELYYKCIYSHYRTRIVLETEMTMLESSSRCCDRVWQLDRSTPGCWKHTRPYTTNRCISFSMSARGVPVAARLCIGLASETNLIVLVAVYRWRHNSKENGSCANIMNGWILCALHSPLRPLKKERMWD